MSALPDDNAELVGRLIQAEIDLALRAGIEHKRRQLELMIQQADLSPLPVTSRPDAEADPAEQVIADMLDNGAGQAGARRERAGPGRQQAEPGPHAVTSRGSGTPAAERKRQQRLRAQRQDMLWSTADWQLFTDPETLSQKAGCHAENLGQVILKELVDNALDIGAGVTLTRAEGGVWIIADDGPGLDPADVPRMFAVNRPLLSSKLKRLPLRGMLGNGLRVVAGAAVAFDGVLIVETRGHRLTLSVSRETGLTTIAADEPCERRPGLIVHVTLPIGGGFSEPDLLARQSIRIARCGIAYSGASSPWWYGPADLHRLLSRVVPETTTVGEVCDSFSLPTTDDRIARSLSRADAGELLARLRERAGPPSPSTLGYIGKAAFQTLPGYAYVNDITTTQSGACIPYVLEAWALCEKSESRGYRAVDTMIFLNRSLTLAQLSGWSDAGGISLTGCGINRLVDGTKAGNYTLCISVIAPYVQLATDGKEPSLVPFGTAIYTAVQKAANAAYRQMVRPDKGLSIRDAAFSVMDGAYSKASGGGRYPANARQIMYAARPDILRLTGKDKLDDAYFTQVLLPDYVDAHNKIQWDVVFDARGSLTEPHTEREVPLGTIDVRAYLGDRAPIGAPAVELNGSDSFNTAGPEHRYRSILFIEKEGFAPLLKTARIAARHDIAVMSTKGMSTTAARLLLDRLAPDIDNILVLHDFDISGFSIFGTLSSDGRRYRFQNELPIYDIGLRLADIESMDLQSEPVTIDSRAWPARSRTLAGYGAEPEEISFLSAGRVELNAMAADVFIKFLEHQLARHGVQKVVPDADTLERHARQVLTNAMTEQLLLEHRPRLLAQAAAATLPGDLCVRVKDMLAQRPELAWDQAVAAVARGAA